MTEIQDANIQDAIHCVKVELEEEVCEECRFHRLCHIWCKDVSRIKLEALEKQMPKKPTETQEFEDGTFYRIDFMCPSCNTSVIGQPYKPNYCKHCGQKLDWEEGGTSD